jgi:hypothetical protein
MLMDTLINEGGDNEEVQSSDYAKDFLCENLSNFIGQR